MTNAYRVEGLEEEERFFQTDSDHPTDPTLYLDLESFVTCPYHILGWGIVVALGVNALPGD
jgi:hypothetical protein